METTEELQNREMCYKKMSSGYNITVTLMKPLQLWFPAQDQHKIGSVSISQWVVEGLMSFHNTLRYYCRLTVADVGVPFSLVMNLLVSCHSSVNDFPSTLRPATSIKLSHAHRKTQQKKENLSKDLSRRRKEQ